MKKPFKFLLIAVSIFAVIIMIAFVAVSIRMNGQVKAFDRSIVDVSQVADGVYYGQSETDLVKVEVRVTVSDGTIRDIEILKHDCGKGAPANAMIYDMMEKNDVEVDAVSGATISSEVIKDAVRQALRTGLPD